MAVHQGPDKSSPVRVAPSRLGAPLRERATAQAAAAREAGRLAHALIESLPDIAPKQRAGAAARFLAAQGGALLNSELEAMTSRILKILDDPQLAALFGPGSRAEVAISGVLARPGAPPIVISGRIDRLVVLPDRVEIVDFKSGAGGRAAYVRQLALYVAALEPLYRQPVRASLVWLKSGQLEELSKVEIEDMLREVSFAAQAAP